MFTPGPVPSAGRSRRPHRWLPHCKALTLVLALTSGGCDLFNRDRDADDSSSLPPYLARMRSTYPDLASGRFLAIAHMEAPNQAELFRVVDDRGNPDGRTQPTISVLRSRNETGGGGLFARLDAPGDTLLLDAERSRELALRRDWSAYHVLLFSTYGPADGAALHFFVRSGDASPLEWTQTISATSGWKLHRIDLAPIADAVDLEDIRAIGWRAAPAQQQTVDLFLDDVILADNTLPILTTPSDDAASLYAFEQGRRIHVGVAGRFELAFMDGLLVGWWENPTPPAALKPRTPAPTDPADAASVAPDETPRKRNLTVWSGLGPHPTPLAADAASPVGFAPDDDDPETIQSWGVAVAASQEVASALPQRVVIVGRQRYLSSPLAAPEPSQSPGHDWRYVIYPDGAVYTTVVSNAPTDTGWSAATVGYAIALTARAGFRAPRPDVGFALLSRPGAADLLWAPHDASSAQRGWNLIDDDARRVVTVLGGVPAEARVESSHLLRFWPTDLDALVDAAAFVDDYRLPARLDVIAGDLVTDASGDRNQDGFNEAQGCYELALVDGVARVKLDPRGILRHHPRLRVRGPAEARLWAYVDGRRITDITPLGPGQWLLRLPAVLSAEAELEVHAAITP